MRPNCCSFHWMTDVPLITKTKEYQGKCSGDADGNGYDSFEGDKRNFKVIFQMTFAVIVNGSFAGHLPMRHFADVYI